MMRRRLAFLLIALKLLALYAGVCRGFAISKRRGALSCHDPAITLATTGRRYSFDRRAASAARLHMRDASSANWFRVGDTVRVVDDVLKAGTNLRGRTGTVLETWEKCDVDPTCCCAEQVDLGMAVTVRFDSKEDDRLSLLANDTFVHYFAEEELIKICEDELKVEAVVDAGVGATVSPASDEEVGAQSSVAFDGMSCRAFKLEQLQMGEQARRIAAYESRKDDDCGKVS